ncbi:MAG: pyridoxal-phosphate dependent enzyme, partial [Bacteroidia bacterium]
GIDTYGSVFKKYKETGIFDESEIYPYVTEGIGEDILPQNVDFDVIDLFEKVTDKDAAVYTRRLAREEGIFVGNSAGAAIKGILQLSGELKEDDVVVVLFHDHGSRYVGKIFNDDWMREQGFLEESIKTAADVIAKNATQKNKMLYSSELIAHAVANIRKFGYSQFPIIKEGKIVGSVDEDLIYEKLTQNPENCNASLESIMKAPFPIVREETTLEEIAALITPTNKAVLVDKKDGTYHIISRYDIIEALS